MEKPLIKLEMLRCCNKRLLALAIFLTTSLMLCGQITSHHAKRILFKANQKFDYGDYPHALTMYLDLLLVDSMDAELNYKIGVCMFEDKKIREQSKKHFEKTSITKYPETNYYLGRLYHSERNFDKAIDAFHSYMNYKKEKEHSVKEVEDLIEKCYYAKLQIQHATDNEIIVANMGDNINSEYSEYAPLIPAAEDALYFTSRRKNNTWNTVDALENYYEDIYVSYKNEDGTWKTPTMLDTVINSAYHDAATGLSADGEKILIYHTSEDHLHGHIYISELINGKWTKPHRLDANINSLRYNETSACFSPDGEMIFFSSDREGGYGGKDLYSIKKAPNGRWAKPMNLGPTINTEYNEDAPFIHPRDSALYFSSEGHQNMGGYDVFKSYFDEAEHFGTPQNIGFPVNTVEDDIFFVLNVSGSTGYISSSRKKGSYGAYDIYRVNFAINNAPMSVYTIHCVDAVSNSVIKKIEIVATDIEKKTLYGIFNSNQLSGKIILITKPNKEYTIAIQAPGYESLVIDNYLFYEELVHTFKLTKKQ